jgi:hypothetical protein
MSKTSYEKKQVIRQIKDILKRFQASGKLDESAEQLYSLRLTSMDYATPGDQHE